MNKIATPQALQSELREILAYCETHQPSRTVLASKIQNLSERLAADKVKYVTVKIPVRTDGDMDWDSGAVSRLKDVIFEALSAYEPKARGKAKEILEGVVMEDF